MAMQPRFTKIKLAIRKMIESGQMKPGDQVASENQLAEQFSVSRMTARRALTELVDEGILIRSQGLGTFVSDLVPMSSILTIQSIDNEIQQRGHRYSNHVVSLSSLAANDHQSKWLGVSSQSQVFESCIVHLENDLPIQFEQRWVSPIWAPDYLSQDLSQITPSNYLNSIAPLTEADQIVEAVLAHPQICELLAIEPDQPCLKISRRTYSDKGIVSYAQLYHPGNRYRLGGHLDF